MPKMMNCVSMAGYLVADPQSRPVGETKVCNFRLATNNGPRKQNGADVEDTTFLNHECWGKSGETLQQFATKGTGIWVSGSLHCNEQDITVVNQDGSTTNRKYPHYKVRVREWGFLPGNKNANGQAAQPAASAGTPPQNGKVASYAPPNAGQAMQAQAGMPYQSGAPDDFGFVDDNEDLPF